MAEVDGVVIEPTWADDASKKISWCADIGVFDRTSYRTAFATPPPVPDTTPPTITITSGRTSRSVTYRLTGRSDERLSLLTYELNGGAAVNITPEGFTFSVEVLLAPGRNVFRIYAADQATPANNTECWFAVRVEADALVDRSERLLKMFPLGMRPR